MQDARVSLDGIPAFLESHQQRRRAAVAASNQEYWIERRLLGLSLFLTCHGQVSLQAGLEAGGVEAESERLTRVFCDKLSVIAVLPHNDNVMDLLHLVLVNDTDEAHWDALVLPHFMAALWIATRPLCLICADRRSEVRPMPCRCESHFCRRCMTEWHQKQPTCPHCRQSASGLIPLIGWDEVRLPDPTARPALSEPAPEILDALARLRERQAAAAAQRPPQE